MKRFDIESSVFGLAPWIAPAIPAYFAVDHARKYLLTGGGLDEYFVWIVGLTVELVGMAAVHTTLEFWQWNKEKSNKAPVWMAAFAAGFYVTTVITVNAILDLWHGVTVQVFAKALLSTLTIPSALVIGLRALHKRRIAEWHEEAERRRAERERLRAERRTPERTPNERRTPERTPNERRTPERTPNARANTERPMGFPTNTRILEYVENIRTTERRTPGPSEIARTLGVSKSYASEVLNGLKE